MRGLAAVVAGLLVGAACSGNAVTGDDGAPTTTSTATVAVPSSTTTAPVPAPVVIELCPGTCEPAFVTAATWPVGPDGVGYVEADLADFEPTGPAGLAIARDGTVWVLDTVQARLVGRSMTDRRDRVIDLGSERVGALVDLAAGPNSIAVLDVDVAQSRYLVHRLDASGAYQSTIPLPEGLWLDDGLTGIALSPDDELWVELELGRFVAQVTDEAVGAYSLSDGYPFDSGVFRQSDDAPATFRAGDTVLRLSAPEEALVGAAHLLGVGTDGSIVLAVEEVMFGAVITVEFGVGRYLADGSPEGSARFVPAEQYIPVEHPLALGPDGYVYALLTFEDRVDVVRLGYGR